MIRRDWYGCYGNGWAKILTAESFAHPAKVAFGLADRIYNHALEMGYLKPGDTVLDPFFGIGGFAYHALLQGLNVVGVELEEKFVKLAQANLDRWRADYGPGVAVLDSLREQGTLPPYGRAQLIQGDSRELGAVLREAGGVVSSPPWSSQQDGGKVLLEQRDSMTIGRRNCGYRNQGSTPGQLANLPEGTPPDALVSSPPYAESIDPRRESERQSDRDHRRRIGRNPDSPGSLPIDDYGDSAGQLGRMRVVSSPPWENSLETGKGLDIEKLYDGMVEKWGRSGSQEDREKQVELMARRIQGRTYGKNDAQLGAETGSDFWTAARQIMQQVAQVLPPGAYAIWVTKRFVRDKQIVDFSQQWAALGESCGFETVEWIRAWLIEDRGQQYDLFGGLEQKQVKRASFFRRLYESKYPENSIDWEDVIIQRRLA